jgi:hypothetical protein
MRERFDVHGNSCPDGKYNVLGYLLSEKPKEKESVQEVKLDFTPPKVNSKTLVWAYDFELGRFVRGIVEKTKFELEVTLYQIRCGKKLFWTYRALNCKP